ncbi:MAG TPA: cell division protein FtsK, partial [Streptomyces sp.]|nr:cell division protein FtsK [Streptomyces sp.]
MNHDDENELFNRLEADMATEAETNVVELNPARSKPTDRPPTEAPEPVDPTATVMVDGPQAKEPGYLSRIITAKRRA